MTVIRSSAFRTLEAVVRQIVSIAPECDQRALQSWIDSRWSDIVRELTFAGDDPDVYAFIEATSDSLTNRLLGLLNAGYPGVYEAPIDYIEALHHQAMAMAAAAASKQEAPVPRQMAMEFPELCNAMALEVEEPVAANPQMAMAA